MKFFYIGLLSWLVSLPALSQSTITIRMVYNTSQNRYEVYAKPNFTAKGFSFGPSQVSVVMPVAAPDEVLTIRSTSAGTWADNSMVLKPAVAPQSDFHGVSTQGGKADLTATQDILLFDFALKQGFLSGVRLFVNGSDPGSDKPGMQGGDFRIYLSDAKGANYAVIDPTIPGTSTTSSPGTSTTSSPGTSTTSSPGTSTTSSPGTSIVLAVPVSTDLGIRVTAYPNPGLAGEIRLLLNGFSPSEKLKVTWMTLSGSVLSELSGRADELSQRVFATPPVQGVLLMRVERLNSRQLFVSKVLIGN